MKRGPHFQKLLSVPSILYTKSTSNWLFFSLLEVEKGEHNFKVSQEFLSPSDYIYALAAEIEKKVSFY